MELPKTLLAYLEDAENRRPATGPLPSLVTVDEIGCLRLTADGSLVLRLLRQDPVAKFFHEEAKRDG